MDEGTAISAMERIIVDSVRLFEHDLQFYEKLPKGSMNVEDLEKLVMGRLTILRTVEQIAQTRRGRSVKACRRVLTKRLRSAGYKSFADLCEGTGYSRVTVEQRYAARMKDHVSHFILLLGMSQSSATRYWIQKMEGLLFEWRLSALDDDGIEAFMAINDVSYPVVDEDDKRCMKDRLKPLMKHPSAFDSTAFYRIPAVEMLRSETRRHIYFKEGVAYPEHSNLLPAILYQYKRRLRSRIQRLIGAHNYMIDPRIRVVVESVQKRFATTKSTVWNVVAARVDKLDKIAKTSYPPCMRNLHEGLRKTHHLRNQGRVQYTLFLNAIGIKAEDAIEFYKAEFTQDIDEVAFEKQYTYIFRHLYGLVGSKIVHDVPSCSKMASEKPGSNEYHGCPFATNDIEDLDKLLTRWQIGRASKYGIVGRVLKNDCGKACAGYFAAIHGRTALGPITNPKDFYQQSTQLHETQDFTQLDTASTKPDDVECDDCESSEQSASSDEHDESDEKYQFLRSDERVLGVRKELVEFYKSIDKGKELGGNKSETSNNSNDRSYLDYILEHFKN